MAIILPWIQVEVRVMVTTMNRLMEDESGMDLESYGQRPAW
jgi:hypothetical protein